MSRVLMAVAAAATTAVLVAAGYGGSALYSGPATKAAAQADRRAHISAPTKGESPIGKPVTRFEFRLSRNIGEVAIYRTHTGAVKALAQAETLAKLFGQSLEGLAAVYGNAIVGFDKPPTSGERTEAHGWLR
jgi:hypothetical protein